MMNDGDISHTITAKSDQLNASDLIGGTITVCVQRVSINRSDQPVSIEIDGGHKPFKPCLTVRRILAKMWGRKSGEWIGRSMTLYCDDTVMWAGERAGGIRVSHMSHISEATEVTVRASKHKVMKHVIHPLSTSLPAYSDKKIDANETAWREKFLSGKSPGALIKKIKSEFSLTDEQEKRILGLARIDGRAGR